MAEYTFNYIITIHNKQDLIEQVLRGVMHCAGEKSTIYTVLDGCTDATEQIVDRIIEKSTISIQKIFADDVHEIRSLNVALGTIAQTGQGFNITLQDDVIINDQNLEKHIIAIYEHIGYEHVGVLGLRHGVNVVLDEKMKELKEVDIIESSYGTGMSTFPLKTGSVIERMVGVRSPECFSFHIIQKMGLLDDALAPYTYDNHDYSLRCLESGYRNFVASLPFESDVKWGGTRTNPHPEFKKIVDRNKHYLYSKHKAFLRSKVGKEIYTRCRRARPFSVSGVEFSGEEKRRWLQTYNMQRKSMLGSLRVFKSKYIHHPIKKFLLTLHII